MKKPLAIVGQSVGFGKYQSDDHVPAAQTCGPFRFRLTSPPVLAVITGDQRRSASPLPQTIRTGIDPPGRTIALPPAPAQTDFFTGEKIGPSMLHRITTETI